jgi:hypothetical protein
VFDTLSLTLLGDSFLWGSLPVSFHTPATGILKFSNACPKTA